MIKVYRKENWPVLLAAYFKEMENVKFEWGKNDCVSYGLNGAKAITGYDYYKPYRGKYDSEETAKICIKVQGKGSLYSGGVYFFGKKIPVSFAQRGDLVIKKKEQCVGICDGQYTRFLGAPVFNDIIGKDGLVNLLTLECDYAFKVGR